MKIDNKKVPDSFQAYLVEGAHFTKYEEYPILEDYMISKSVPVDIMPFNKAITYRGDLSKTFICFFEPDDTFERIRRNPRRYLKFFKRTAGIIGLDFSVHSDMQVIKQKSQMNDNLSLSYFYGKQGVKLIPNIRRGIDELIPEYLETIPKHSIIAVGTHGFIKTNQERYEWYCFLERLIKELEPTEIIVYGTLPGELFNNMKNKQKFVFYDSWIAKRVKEVNCHGN